MKFKSFSFHRLIFVTLLAVLVGGAAYFALLALGAFRTEPKVEILPVGGTNGTLRVVTDSDYWPYSFFDKSGNLSGREVEIANAIAKILGMNIELSGHDWNKCLELASRHEVDLVLTCSESPTGRDDEGLVSSLPLSSDDYIVFGKKPIGSVAALKGTRLAQLTYGNVNPVLDAAGLKPYITYFPSHRDVFRAIEEGSQDYTVIRYTPALGILKDLGFSDIKPQCFAGGSFFCIGIDDCNPELAKKVNAAIMLMRLNGELWRLSEKWLTAYARPMTFSEAVAAHPDFTLTFVLLVSLLFILVFAAVWIRARTLQRTDEELEAANRHERLRADSLNFIYTHDSIEEFIPYLAERILAIYGCDQVIYRDSTGRMILNEKPGTPPLDFSLCADCPHYAFDAPVYADGKTIMDDCSVGYKGVPVHPNCHVKASLTQIVYHNGTAFGYIALHYLDKTHHFTPSEIESFDRIATFLSLILDRADSGQKLKEALQLAEAASRAKTAFLFNMSHDIRTPMNAIKGFTEIARKSIDDRGKVMDCLGKIDSSGALLLSLINNILDVSRIESGKATVEEIPGNVMQSFDDIRSTMLELAKTRDVSLSFEFGEIRNRFIYADDDKVNRVFVNIISNAIKYSRPNGWVKVRCEEVGEKSGSGDSRCSLYRYTFEDNGIGMSEEFQRHVFEEFAREQNSTTSGVQGTGLGMSLVKSFVDLMGGTISCESKQGVGTTFTVILPYKLREDDASAAESSAAEGNAASGSGPAEADPRYSSTLSKRVLLVEDNEMNREVAVFMLEENGFTVDTAENGRVAVEKATSGSSYDIILMDIQMPVMNGLEATKAIRAAGVTTPIIALSANAFAEDKAASIAAGMNDHVAKPIRINELLVALAKASKTSA